MKSLALSLLFILNASPVLANVGRCEALFAAADSAADLAAASKLALPEGKWVEFEIDRLGLNIHYPANLTGEYVRGRAIDEEGTEFNFVGRVDEVKTPPKDVVNADPIIKVTGDGSSHTFVPSRVKAFALLETKEKQRDLGIPQLAPFYTRTDKFYTMRDYRNAPEVFKEELSQARNLVRGDWVIVDRTSPRLIVGHLVFGFFESGLSSGPAATVFAGKVSKVSDWPKITVQTATGALQIDDATKILFFHRLNTF